MEFKSQSFNFSESAILGEVEQIALCVEDLRVEGARLRQLCCHKVRNVLSECGGMQVRLGGTAFQFLGFGNLLTSSC